MNFFKILPKDNFIKKRLHHKCFAMNIPKVLGTEHLSFLQKLAEFHYHKKFETSPWWLLIVCMVERSPSGLSITGDIKIYQGHPI